MSKTIFLFLFFIVLLGTIYWYNHPNGYTLKPSKDLASKEQIAVFYSKRAPSNREIKQLNLNFDAVVVPEFYLVDRYRCKGATIPVFFIPYTLDLNLFLNQPLKSHPNPIFTFGHIASSNSFIQYVDLIHAFIQAFGLRKDVALYIHFPSRVNVFNKKQLRYLVSQLGADNIFLLDTKWSKKNQLAFFKSLDCYINLSSDEKFLGSALNALALGIPVITTPEDLILNKSGYTLPNTWKSLKGDEALAYSLLEAYRKHDQQLQYAQQARDWVINYEPIEQKALQSMLENLTNPKKVIFGKENIVQQGYLKTNSPKLYLKYISQQISTPTSLETNPLTELLRPLDPPSMSTDIEGIDCLYVINLDERPARWESVKKQFEMQNIKPYRVNAINGWKIPKEKAIPLFDPDADLLRTPFGGALGCLLSHVSIYKDALERGFETIWICEDDIEFKQSSKKITYLIEQLTSLDPEWDILYTDYSSKGEGLQQPRPGQHFYEHIHIPISKELIRIHGRRNTHSMIFSKKGLEKVYKYLTTGRLWSPIDIDIHYTPGLKEYSVTEDIVTSIYDSSLPAFDGSSDTQLLSSLNEEK